MFTAGMQNGRKVCGYAETDRVACVSSIEKPKKTGTYMLFASRPQAPGTPVGNDSQLEVL